VRPRGDDVDLSIPQRSNGPRRRGEELDMRLYAFGGILPQLLGGESWKVRIGHKVWHGDAHGAPRCLCLPSKGVRTDDRRTPWKDAKRMRCEYSRGDLVSSGKYRLAPGAGEVESCSVGSLGSHSTKPWAEPSAAAAVRCHRRSKQGKQGQLPRVSDQRKHLLMNEKSELRAPR
jgi:hypothetical protein